MLTVKNPTIYATTVNSEVNKIDGLAQGSQRVLLDIKSVFPFDLFPDEVIIDETKITIQRNFFFFTGQSQSVNIADIFNVVVNHGIFFAKLELFDRYFAEQPISVEYLKKEDAARARQIIQGLVLVKKNNIDTSSLSVDNLTHKLDRIGQSR
jgi:hypothetical protein